WELGGPRDGLPRATSVPIPTTDPIARLLTVGFSRDGGLLALESTGWSARQQVYLKLWDLDGHTERVLLKRKAPLEKYVASLSPGGTLLAGGPRLEMSDYVSQVRLWDWGRDTARVLLEHPSFPGNLLVSPDGGTVLVKGEGGTLQLLDLDTGKERVTLKG